MHTIFSILLAATLVAGAAEVPTPTPPSDPTGETLFATVQQRATAWAYPRYATYHVAVTFTVGGKPVADTWETHEDIAHGAVLADIFSREDGSDPHTPHGIDVTSPSLGISTRRSCRPGGDTR